MSRKQRGGIVFFLSLVLLLLLSGCGTTKSEPSNEENTTQAKVISPDDYPIVTITMEDNSTITLELYPDKAPNTVNNFVSLVNKGFYDGLIFHRIIPDFMIQGGDPNGNGTGGPGYSIKGEFSENGFENDLKHERGVISMARSQLPDSAGSQFFIMVADAPHLDGEYAPFGKVIEGMDVVDKIVSSKRDKNDKPVEEIKMKQVTVDTKGIDYEEPKKIKE
ncbi:MULTISPECIES: peptidylprolyl isomerase [Niallia]|uniref:peptidylprolyl isomerase n=1 Tax=Niallia TaxID=2837506 RepID=UPI000F450D1D|nr:peptidylprolyl isomerase [Niallia circulans]AYV66480.1 peptidylprolyl isomerase [Niallia circulans]AYV70702.1 peptidylprolyl isomerase [Niallia circulans]